MKRYTKPVIICAIILAIILFSMRPAYSDYPTINATRIKLRTVDGDFFVDTFKIDDQKCILPSLFSGRPLACWLDNNSPIDGVQ